jgi:sugar phosphate isomerase/epimerase
MRTDQIALQLYTVRWIAADDLPGTLDAVAAAGYRAVEVAGLPELPTGELARRLADAGLTAIAAHEPIEALRRDWQGVADRLAAMDCPRAIVPWLPEEERRSADDVRRFAADLGGYARRLAGRGIRLGYHNPRSSSRRSRTRPSGRSCSPSSRPKWSSSSTSTGRPSGVGARWPRSPRRPTVSDSSI